jgi:hypothetical protein
MELAAAGEDMKKLREIAKAHRRSCSSTRRARNSGRTNGSRKPSFPEFGVKVSVATTVKHSAGGQFVAHAAALPGNPYDGHTLGTVIPQMEALIGKHGHDPNCAHSGTRTATRDCAAASGSVCAIFAVAVDRRLIVPAVFLLRKTY